MKNKQAQALANIRWSKTTKEQRKLVGKKLTKARKKAKKSLINKI